MSKVVDLRQAVADHVHDGDVVALGGFTHLIPFAAGHEIIRQHCRDLTLCRLTPDVVADQLVAAGCVRKLVFSWLGNPGVGSLHAIRRRLESNDGLEIEEYSHFGMVGRYVAGAAGLPFYPLRSYEGSDLPSVNPLIVPIRSPFGDDEVYAVPPLTPDVAIIHVQRSTPNGDAQVWGLVGAQREEAMAASKVIVTCEEIVDESVVRRDPNRTLIPGFVVDAVVEVPGGCHPSYAQGHYDRDNRFYVDWEAVSRDPDLLEAWIAEWVHGVDDHRGYLERLGSDRWASLLPGSAPSGSVDYGSYP